MAEIKFIGTGSGKTSLSRFHSSFIISTSTYNLLVDAGDGVSKVLLSQGIDYTNIDGVLFTHFHPDHYTGFAALIVQMKMYNRKNKLDVFVNSELAGVIKQFLINSYLFPERMEFSISYHEFNSDEQFNIDDEINVLPRQNSHLQPISKLRRCRWWRSRWRRCRWWRRRWRRCRWWYRRWWLNVGTNLDYIVVPVRIVGTTHDGSSIDNRGFQG